LLDINQLIAAELGVNERQVRAAVDLLDEGATVPFIARYRKEVTGSLDDTQLRKLEERLVYLRELQQRRATILDTIRDQGKLDAPLEAAIEAALTKTELEDLYLPYKRKRRTKGEMAKEAGLEPLALGLLDDPAQEPETLADGFVAADKGIADRQAALDGARYILMERFAEEAELVGGLRDTLWERGNLVSEVVEKEREAGAKFSDYFDYSEALKKVPSHRALALFRGRNEGVLRVKLSLPEEQSELPLNRIAAHVGISDQGRPADRWLLDAVRWTWRVKLLTRLETDLLGRLREAAEEEAIRVFGRNLGELLLAAPAGRKGVMGLDPGLRTGVKVAVVDATGKVVDTAAIFPHVPRKRWDEAIATLAALCKRHHTEVIAIGNGTASRETDQLAAELIQRHPELKLNKLMVSEAGASVYSASELAAHEMPDLDVTLRGAVSIARRLQDPLAELVKIEAKAIGVGQYQHDVNQVRLARALEGVVEDCVNAVGVDINTASEPLLTQVAGLTPTLARNLISYRDEHGALRNRRELMKVPRFGAKAFEQSAGFLRIPGSDNPLDASAVHPEANPLVEEILKSSGRGIDAVLGDKRFLDSLDVNAFTNERFGLPTVRDIIVELEKPGRDPRPEFVTATFRQGVETLADLEPGMILEGVVTNVTNFGAFIDIGVHQDGLAHISQLADRFVKDPHDVVGAGKVVKVKVLEVDQKRKRIALTLKLKEAVNPRPARTGPEHRGDKASGKTGRRGDPRGAQRQKRPAPVEELGNSLADAFAKARL
jgi:uncharacterized protein